MHLIKHILPLGTLLLLSALLGSCANEVEQPPGFELRTRFVSVDVAVIDEMTILFVPQGVGESFGMIVDADPMTDGPTVEVDDEGRAIVTISGDYIRAQAEESNGMVFFGLEIWADDTTPPESAPRVDFRVTRSGELIANGSGYLPSWPPEPTGSHVIAVQCLPDAAAENRCLP